MRADVEEILVEGDRAVGVRLQGGEEIRAGRIVSACGIQSTVMRLLPQRFRSEQWVRDVETLDPAPAHVCVYLGFNGDIRKAGAGSANKWFYETWVSEKDIWSIVRSRRRRAGALHQLPLAEGSRAPAWTRAPPHR